MQIIPYAWLLLLGCLPLIYQSQLLSYPVLLLLLVIAIIMWRFPYRGCHYLGWLLVFFSWGQANGLQLLSSIAGLTAQPIDTEVRVSEYQKDKQRLKLALVNIQGKIQFPVRHVWISQLDAQDYCVGQRWIMRLRLRAVHSLLNQGGYDSQRKALADNTPFRGKILSQSLIDPRCSLRHQLDQTYQRTTEHSPWRSISRALLFGLRDMMPIEINQLFRETGVAHLMAISGMHIGLMFIIGRLVVKLLQPWLPRHFQSPTVAVVCGWCLSLGYCVLSGGQPSALRAMFALSLWQIARRLALNVTSFDIVLGCVAGLLVIDPIMVLSDSLWLSVLAVIALLLWYRWFPLPPAYRTGKRWYVLQLVHLQVGILLLLLPIQVFFFQGISIAGLSANLFAIPVITLGILPLSVIMLIPWPAVITSFCLTIHDGLLSTLIYLLNWQRGYWININSPALIALGGWGVILIVRFRLWQTYPVSATALLVSCLSWRLATDKTLWRIDMLDVGHGLAVVISQGRQAVIYDTGNRWLEGDVGERILVPWLTSQHLEPQQVIISHRHLDHYGGLASLLKAWPRVVIRTSYSYPNAQPCRRGEQWQWQRLTFRVLWPIRADTAGQNNDSCVIHLSDGRYHLLLTGDIERKAEQEISALEKAGMSVTWLQVPHHGSRTSSSPLFLRKVTGQVALASVARYNAWRLPSEKVVKQYRQAGYQWHDTAVTGQLSIRVMQDKVQILQMRDQIQPRWYHQWFGVKPDYR